MKFLKGGSGTILLDFVIALILVVNGLEARSVLEPSTIDPRPPAAAAVISAQHNESLTGLITMPETARRSIAMNAGNRGLVHAADSHDRSSCSPPYNDRWAFNSN
jgi:hypothetical protein